MSEGNLGGFNTEAPENQKPVLPAGEYDVVMVKSEVRQSEGKAKNLYCEFKVLSGEFQNQVLVHRFNLWHAKPDVTQISRGQLSAFGKAVNVLTINDSSELEMKPVRVKVNAKDNGEFGMQNNITAFKPRSFSGSPPAPPAAPADSEQQAIPDVDDDASAWG